MSLTHPWAFLPNSNYFEPGFDTLLLAWRHRKRFLNMKKSAMFLNLNFVLLLLNKIFKFGPYLHITAAHVCCCCLSKRARDCFLGLSSPLSLETILNRAEKDYVYFPDLDCGHERWSSLDLLHDSDRHHFGSTCTECSGLNSFHLTRISWSYDFCRPVAVAIGPNCFCYLIWALVLLCFCESYSTTNFLLKDSSSKAFCGEEKISLGYFRVGLATLLLISVQAWQRRLL